MNKPIDIRRVWIRKKDAQIGIGYPNSIIGDLWIFAEHDDDEVLDPRFCLFMEDHKIKRTEFIDVGAFEEWKNKGE